MEIRMEASFALLRASRDAKKKKKKTILQPQTPLYLFYQSILQLTLHPNFYFSTQPNKIIYIYIYIYIILYNQIILGTKCIRTSICNVLANHDQNIKSRFRLAQSVFICRIRIE